MFSMVAMLVAGLGRGGTLFLENMWLATTTKIPV
jgi:hypothetical protein